MKKPIALAGILTLSLALQTALAASPRPADWAAPVSDAGVENLYRIESDLYRSAAPGSAGFQKLAQLGVKSVLDLRGGGGDKQTTGAASFKLFQIPMSAWGLHNAQVLQALRILADRENRPLLIHCQHGADRTGAIVALYRVVVQAWSKEDAIREMKNGGYHHNSFFRNLDQYVLEADVAALRGQLGIRDPLNAPTSGPFFAGNSGPLVSSSGPVVPAAQSEQSTAGSKATQEP